jgi:plasmid stabilization system protein ParE
MELGGILSTAFRMAVHKMACGQSFAAVCKGMAECTPNARAVILYRIEDQDVVILRVLRGSRKIAALFSP